MTTCTRDEAAAECARAICCGATCKAPEHVSDLTGVVDICQAHTFISEANACLATLDRLGWLRQDGDTARVAEIEAALHDERMEHNLLKELLSRPEIDDFCDGVVIEAAHQRQRWGDAHDRSKSAENWFWLIGYLAGKALRSAIEGNQNKAKHHTISSAAALFQWWKAIAASPSGVGADADLDPTSASPAEKDKSNG